MKFDLYIEQLWNKINVFHVFCAVTLIILFSIGYAKSANNPITPEILHKIKSENPKGIHMLEKNKMQVLFMQERSWFFILFTALVLSIVLWAGLSNRKQRSKTYIGYKYRVSEKLTRTVKERLNFQERLRIKYEALTANDLLVAELLVNGLSSKEISSELNISVASANTARYRLRKRMVLSPQTDLLDVLRQI